MRQSLDRISSPLWQHPLLLQSTSKTVVMSNNYSADFSMSARSSVQVAVAAFKSSTVAELIDESHCLRAAATLLALCPCVIVAFPSTLEDIDCLPKV